ncbi:hypothetical protein FGG08_004817 [Glutinoglossum americanum]|uniref:serine--tRNA ligase n=1 Tax=Glutinoglossum americanum TaxID=1670608 RepID=A0A9P8HZR6_9PEZI|nr:hypothetical protein FGG08_004817 [Glutinoglossum americanum]
MGNKQKQPKSRSRPRAPTPETTRLTTIPTTLVTPLHKAPRSTLIMIDVLDFIVDKGGDPEKIRESQRRRSAPVDVVDEGKQDASELLQKKAELEREKKSLEDQAAEKDSALQKKIKTIGNYVHHSVHVSNDEGDNPIIREWKPEGASVEKRDCLSHHEVLSRLDGYDPERGVKIVGHRGYFLKQYGVFLNQALINYGLEFLSSRGYTAIQTPQFMLKQYMAKTAQLEQFDEELYKVVDGDEQNDKYLIATSEQPISAFHADEWLIEKELPIKYGPPSTQGPDDSWKAFDDMISVSEEFYKSLGIPYRIVAIVSGALNNAAAKKYDLEAWFPFQGEYKELVSCSNCTDYQSRALEIRCGTKTQTDLKKKYVHALNSTLCATERALCCILENFQTEDGFNVPEPLRKYIPGSPGFIEFTKELPKDTTSQKLKGKAAKASGEGPADKLANLRV